MKRLILLVLAVATVSGGVATYTFNHSTNASSATSGEVEETLPTPTLVTALGRLEPETPVIKLSAPLALDGDRVKKILLQEGDGVKAGQVIAILDSQDKLQSAVERAQKQVKVAQAKLKQIQSGAKPGEIQSQKANVEKLKAEYEGNKNAYIQTIARIEAQWQGDRTAQEANIRQLAAELKNAKSEYQRYQQLYSQGAVSNSLIDSKRLNVETSEQKLTEARAILERINTTASKQLAEARVQLNRISSTSAKQIRAAEETLNSIADVRSVDVNLAKTELESAVSVLNSAKTDLESAFIRAPMSGRILKIHTRAGEKITASGIADFAQTEKMSVVAEVYQTDINRVKIGQKARIMSPTLSEKLEGNVIQIGLQVNRQNVFSNQPGENLDSRVVEVKIRLTPEDSKKVAGLTNLQVQTAIEL
ncbi:MULTISPECIES: ABC exporter membrane fusion protein [Cylindrospermopsis]|uniref:ABC exporter membrane fusion protein n=1 Tax=Cylindrospermopsis curvispora GIHE-G1 TaxID=2666332 RepID=A0A7H0F069_9CYAN|nr:MULTISPECIES: ABC exporter membrane fusion protein [Cylindrospermopsis]QNP29435.1 ABC exporter membrane fusion protein [Cylindrospermopsis curvispora GIHE-G1]UJL33484.1 ABC exporter membrane fusion protein [Cylindrospermopsis raciborskii Cr2010]